jgi:hypothetical protein
LLVFEANFTLFKEKCVKVAQTTGKVFALQREHAVLKNMKIMPFFWSYSFPLRSGSAI